MHEADDLALLMRAAETAGQLALQRFRRPFEVWDKGGGQGPVTAVDLEVDALLRRELRAARPDYGWLSEESVEAPAKGRERRSFVVDPIDGTRAFIKGEAGFSHAVAVVEDGEPVAGVVHLPARGETYAAARGEGARLDGRPISGSTSRRLEDARALGAKPQFRDELWPGGAPPCERHFRPSLAWRLCLVASGEFDLMLTLRDSWDWDLAAGAIIAAEAGVRVTDGRGQKLVFNRPGTMQDGIIAAPPALHAELIRLRTAPPAH